MNDEDDVRKRKGCPVCGKTHTKQVIGTEVSVTYCPQCGVPFYMESKARRPYMATCTICHKPFKPEDGGGITVHYPRMQSVETPRGVITGIWVLLPEERKKLALSVTM
jgi:hypothetical protein